jgi:hypothetical protein
MIAWNTWSPATEIGTGASHQEVADAERDIGVRLPASYAVFLIKFGWARVRHDFVYGIGPSCPRPYLLVRHVLAVRTEQPRIPHYLVPIMKAGAGNHYCLDTSRMHKWDCPLVFWNHRAPQGSDQIPEWVAASFGPWLIDRMDSARRENR